MYVVIWLLCSAMLLAMSIFAALFQLFWLAMILAFAAGIAWCCPLVNFIIEFEECDRRGSR